MSPTGEISEGTWYWRVQAGANQSHLILLPLSQPPNALLTATPGPLSAAMPAHSTIRNPEGAKAHEESALDKLKHLFRRPSQHAASAEEKKAASNESGNETPFETIADQSVQGDQMAPAHAMNEGATNMNGNAEQRWPGVINGQKLGAIVVSLAHVDEKDVKLNGGKKGQSAWVTIPINVQTSIPHVGSNFEPRSGTIKFEFDKDWIGAKGEAELLHYHICKAIAERPADAAPQSARGADGQPGSLQSIESQVPATDTLSVDTR